MKISSHKHGGFYTTARIDGKKNFIYGSSESEVETKYIELKYKANQGYNVIDNPTMTDYIVLWFNTCKKGKGAIETQNMYRNCINVHIIPALGCFKIKDITSTQIKTLLNSITSSKSLAHKVRITLNQVFKQAMADRLVSFNPVSNAKIEAPDEPKRTFLSPIQHSIFIDVLRKDSIFPIAYTILYTGMRMGEALALTWDDIDFSDNTIKVVKAFEYEKYRAKEKGPKTKKGIRTITMPNDLASYLENYKKTINNIYLFPSHIGGKMGLTEIRRKKDNANEVLNNWFKNNPKMIESKFNFGFRTLRHTYCTGLYDAGVDEVSAAELMGHDVKIMRDVYTHIQDSRKKSNAVKLNSLYSDISQKDEITN